jgi:hypothetical protein
MGPSTMGGRQNLVSLSKFWILGEFCSRKLAEFFSYRTDMPQSTRNKWDQSNKMVSVRSSIRRNS